MVASEHTRNRIHMEAERADKICEAMKNAAVVVLGDVMMDRYFWGEVERISPEAPVPVVAVRENTVRLGGAANVAWNLVSLGVDARLVAVVGKDERREEVKKLASGKGISTEWLITDSGRVTTEKMRILAHSQQVVRADFETESPVEGESCDAVKRNLNLASEGAGAIVISDYGKGMVTSGIMDEVRKLSRKDDIPVLVDPKEGHFSLYRGATVVTPNRKEACGFYNRKIRSDGELRETGLALLDDLNTSAVLITRGEEGMTLFRKGSTPVDFPTRAREVYDVTGAGDTVISVLAAGLAAGASLDESIELANTAAGIVVRELGTASVTPRELTGAFKKDDNDWTE